jgi:hypothetical protein
MSLRATSEVTLQPAVGRRGILPAGEPGAKLCGAGQRRRRTVGRTGAAAEQPSPTWSAPALRLRFRGRTHPVSVREVLETVGARYDSKP